MELNNIDLVDRSFYYFFDNFCNIRI